MSQKEKKSVRDLYQCFKDTTEYQIKYRCQFGADKECLEENTDYNTLLDNRKKLLSALDSVLYKKDKFIAFSFVTNVYHDYYKLIKKLGKQLQIPKGGGKNNKNTKTRKLNFYQTNTGGSEKKGNNKPIK